MFRAWRYADELLGRTMATATESAVHRAMQAYCLHLGTSINLEWGVAYTSPRFPSVGAANQVREIILEKPEDLPQAFATTEAHFAECGIRCLRWSPAVDQPVEGWAAYLGDHGFRREDFTVMSVRTWENLPVVEGIRVLPARAMRRSLESILRLRYAGANADRTAALVQAATERLNEAQMDGFIATCDKEAVGWCSFLEVGDIGMVTDLYVAERFRRRGVGTTLLGHTLKLARRLLMRVTCVRVDVDRAGAVDLFRGCGMEADGAAVEFVRD